MHLKLLRLGIQFELEGLAGQPLREDDPAVKTMKESAKQLGLGFEVETK